MTYYILFTPSYYDYFNEYIFVVLDLKKWCNITLVIISYLYKTLNLWTCFNFLHSYHLGVFVERILRIGTSFGHVDIQLLNENDFLLPSKLRTVKW